MKKRQEKLPRPKPAELPKNRIAFWIQLSTVLKNGIGRMHPPQAELRSRCPKELGMSAFGLVVFLGLWGKRTGKAVGKQKMTSEVNRTVCKKNSMTSQ
jgi:hypothetical protein